MVIVLGAFEVNPEEREAFIANRIALMRHSRAEAGCITYAFSPDPIDAGTVVLTERWADRASLDAHIAGMKAAPQPSPTPEAISREVTVYEADGGSPL
jgi:quinol monooxygenase YgiN